MDASSTQDSAFLCKTPFVCQARSVQALVLDQLAQDAGSAGFVGARGFEFPGEVVGQVDHTSALRLVGVVVGHVQSEAGEHLVAVHVFQQFHHGVENGAQ